MWLRCSFTQALNDEVFIATKRAARNMSYQDLTPEYAKVTVLAEFHGKDIMALPLSGPLSWFAAHNMC